METEDVSTEQIQVWKPAKSGSNQGTSSGGSSDRAHLGSLQLEQKFLSSLELIPFVISHSGLLKARRPLSKKEAVETRQEKKEEKRVATKSTSVSVKDLKFQGLDGVK